MAPWGAPSEAQVDAAIEKGVAYLLSNQLIDGSWGHRENFAGGHASFTAYVLMKCGLEGDHPAVQRAMAAARARPGDYTYSAACEVLALVAMKGHRDEQQEAWLAERVADLLAWQSSGAGFLLSRVVI